CLPVFPGAFCILRAYSCTPIPAAFAFAVNAPFLMFLTLSEKLLAIGSAAGAATGRRRPAGTSACASPRELLHHRLPRTASTLGLHHLLLDPRQSLQALSDDRCCSRVTQDRHQLMHVRDDPLKRC